MQITFSCKTTTLDYAKTELSSYLTSLNLPSSELERIDISIKIDNDVAKVKECLLDDAFKIEIENGTGEITGINERSALLAVYNFLYKLGFKFLTSVKKDEIIPILNPKNLV